MELSSRYNINHYDLCNRGSVKPLLDQPVSDFVLKLSAMHAVQVLNTNNRHP